MLEYIAQRLNQGRRYRISFHLMQTRDVNDKVSLILDTSLGQILFDRVPKTVQHTSIWAISKWYYDFT